MKKIILLFLIVALHSCQVSKDYVQHISNKGNVINPKTKNILVIASDEVKVNQFKKTFKKNYNNEIDFAKSYLNELTKKLNASNIYGTVKSDSKSNDYISANKEGYDYVIRLLNFNIDNRVEVFHGGGMGVNGMQTSSSTEYSVINVKVEIYDAKTDKEVLDFVVYGEKSVFFFNFTKALQKAKQESIIHIVNYLKSGKITYKG